MISARRKTVGLALGGGGAKGLAHIGVIRVLRNAGIPIDFIAGTSMGALVGAWYAATGDVESLENLFLKLKLRDVFPVTEVLKHKDGTLFRGETIARLLKEEFGNLDFNGCKIPFRAVATEINNGDKVVFSKGKLVDAVSASIALPIVFGPVKLNDRFFADGGLVDPVPADVVAEMGAEYIVAVDVSSKWVNSPSEAAGTRSVYRAVMGAVGIVEYQLAKEVLKTADIVLRPPIFNFDMFDFGKAEEIIDAGADEARLHLRDIRKGAGYAEPPKTAGEKFLDFLFHGNEE